MNPTDLEILETIQAALTQARGLRTVRLVRPKESVEIPLSRLPAAVLEPTGAELLTWPQVPVGAYHLLHWRVAVLDRAVPETRAFAALAALAEAARSALAADLTLGARAADGPASARHETLLPAVGATRLSPTVLTETRPGQPTALVFAGASGYWTSSTAGVASLDGEALFSSGPHLVVAGSPVRRVHDQEFNGLAGGLALDLGDGPREVRQTGVLSAASPSALAIFEAAIEAFIDGRMYTLIAPEGTEYPNCRLVEFARLGPPQVGTAWHQPYNITYRQLAR